MNVQPDDEYLFAALVRDRCLEAARRGYEEAALSGLCEDGRIEMALDAIRSLDMTKIILEHQGDRSTD